MVIDFLPAQRQIEGTVLIVADYGPYPSINFGLREACNAITTRKTPAPNILHRDGVLGWI
jgi:hypothetical protein